jgi:hypothetical protein
MDLIKALTALDSVVYPELLGKMFIINAPRVFVAVWELIKRWIDPRTQSKIEILGNRGVWIARLQDVIGEENLPSVSAPSRIT